jgi:hypothetical protein
MATLFHNKISSFQAQRERRVCPAHLPRRAFTMLEGMIVVCILAVLIGLSSAAISRSRQSTTLVRCIGNLRLIGQGFSNYAAANNDRLPYIKSGIPQWEDLLVTAGLRRDFHFRCPADQEIYPALGSSYDWRDSGPPDQYHRSSMAGRPMHAIRPDLVMSYEMFPDWHRKGYTTTVAVDGSISIMESDFLWINLSQAALP